MNESKFMEKRLKKVLMQDKINAYEGLTRALESDLRLLLGCYMTLCSDVIRYIQEMLGHSSINITEIYTHVAMAKQKDILTTKHPRKDFQI